MYMTIGKYTFEVVNRVPKGYKIWNIPEEVTPAYILLCPKTKDYNVDMNRLKGLYVPNMTVKRNMMKVAMRLSDESPAGIKRYITRYSDSSNTNVQKRIDFYRRMLPVMQSYWEES